MKTNKDLALENILKKLEYDLEISTNDIQYLRAMIQAYGNHCIDEYKKEDWQRRLNEVTK